MKPIQRKALATLIGIVSIIACFVWMVYGGILSEELAWRFGLIDLAVGPDANKDAGTGPMPARVPDEVKSYYLVVLGALLLASGCSAALLVLKGHRRFQLRLGIYLGFLVILLPAAFFNYFHGSGDLALEAKYQVIFNLILVFLGATICLTISSWKADAPDTKVLKVMIFTLLLFSAVLVPSLFTLLWILWSFGGMSLEQVQLVSLDTVIKTAGVISPVVTLLKYFQEQRKLAELPSTSQGDTRMLPTGAAGVRRRGRRN
ncbi:hypothetical protein [Pontibacter harenae]|uniref:hypothetical protein n=1 Tax=Pontibacter harenae TaxID=2894083 RepID=UPI001E483ABF|nr:hypothetical protein [Pontibacter harenae]MCC9167979.1 hypothetical protein [Pontibacter harenae]